MQKVLASLLLLASIDVAAAEQSTSRSFYDRNGSFSGSAITHGNETTAYDRSGKFDGSSIRNSDGTTSFYDRAGRFSGSRTNTTQPR